MFDRNNTSTNDLTVNNDLSTARLSTGITIDGPSITDKSLQSDSQRMKFFQTKRFICFFSFLFFCTKI